MEKQRDVDVLVGDEWFKVPQDDFHKFVALVNAEQVEERLFRPLQTIVGIREFMNN